MIRFGTLGAARITPRALVYPCVDEPRSRISTIAARDRSRAEAFARCHGIPQVVDDYQAVIESDRVDAVYVPLHIPAHHEWTLKALEAGKHVLCEKSMAANAAEAREMADAARDRGLVLMDAFHYRYHPVFLRAREVLSEGMIGEVRHLDASFHVPVRDPQDIRMSYATGGGVTMDIGCYPLSWIRHLLDAEPARVEATAEVGPPDVDVTLTTELEFATGVTARTSGDMRPDTRFQAIIEVTGSAGAMRVINPIVPQNGHEILITRNNETTGEVRDRRPSYGYQLDAFIDAVEQGMPLPTDGEDGFRQMQLIDRCYQAAGLPLRGNGSSS